MEKARHTLTTLLALQPGNAHCMSVVCNGFLSRPVDGIGGFFSSVMAVMRGSTYAKAGEPLDRKVQLTM